MLFLLLFFIFTPCIFSQLTNPRNDYQFEEYDYFEKALESSSLEQLETETFLPELFTAKIQKTENFTTFSIKDCSIQYKNPQIKFLFGDEKQNISANSLSEIFSASGVCSEEEIYLETVIAQISESSTQIKNFSIHIQFVDEAWVMTTFRMAVDLDGDDNLLLNLKENVSFDKNMTKSNLLLNMIPKDNAILTPEFFDFTINFEEFSVVPIEKIKGNGIGIGISVLCIILAILGGLIVLKFKMSNGEKVPVKEEDDDNENTETLNSTSTSCSS